MSSKLIVLYPFFVCVSVCKEGCRGKLREDVTNNRLNNLQAIIESTGHASNLVLQVVVALVPKVGNH